MFVEQHIIMISEDHVTEDWRNGAENTEINYSLTPIHIENSRFLIKKMQPWWDFFQNSFMQMCSWSTKAVRSSTGIFVAIDNNTLFGSKLNIFYVMPKIIRILRSMKIFCTVNISKLNFWLVICIAKNFILTTLKMIFSIFRFFCTLRFQIFKYCPIITNHTSMEILFIQLSDNA